ncbi:MAG: hypothetical protein WC505_03270 [Patescibacteria group bacterium]
MLCCAATLCVAVLIQGAVAATADHFLFTEEARRRLEVTPVADTLTRIRLLTNISFTRANDDYSDARKEAQQLVEAYVRGHSEPVVRAYRSALQVMEIREWSKLRKAFAGAGGLVREAFDSLTALRNLEPKNENIRFLRINVGLEAAANLSDLLIRILEDLEYLDLELDRSDRGACFFLELDWAKYYTWQAETEDERMQQRFLLFAQYHLLAALQYAERPYYREQIISWKQRIDKKKPKIVIWNEAVDKLVTEHE